MTYMIFGDSIIKQNGDISFDSLPFAMRAHMNHHRKKIANTVRGTNRQNRG